MIDFEGTHYRHWLEINGKCCSYTTNYERSPKMDSTKSF